MPLHYNLVAFATATLSLCGLIAAQETTTTTTKPTSVARFVRVDNAQIMYVCGDDVVLKDPDGRLRLLELPAGTPLIVDGKPAPLSELTPGTMLSHVQARTIAESEVTTVTQIDGRVLHVSVPTWVTLRLGDGTIRRYEIPEHATFQVNGRNGTAFDLRPGMDISATAVTTSGLNTHSTRAAMVAQPPAQVGALLILRSR